MNVEKGQTSLRLAFREVAISTIKDEGHLEIPSLIGWDWEGSRCSSLTLGGFLGVCRFYRNGKLAISAIMIFKCFIR